MSINRKVITIKHKLASIILVSWPRCGMSGAKLL